MPYLLIIAALLLSACNATLHKSASAESSKPTPPVQSTNLEQRSATFLYLAAQDAIQQGEYELAIQLLTALVHKQPDADEPRVQLVELLLGARRNMLAEGYLKPLLEKTPLHKGMSDDQLHIHVLHARQLATAGQMDDALDELARILQVKPSLLSARMLQINIYSSQGRLDMAEAAISAGIKSGDSPALRKVQAELLIQQKKYPQAKRALKAMQRLAPNSETPILMQAGLAIQLHDTADAEQILRAFIKTHPQAFRTKNMLGRLLVQEGRTQEAIRIYRSLASDTGNEPNILSALGLLYFQNKQYDKAAEQFRTILSNNPDDGGSHYYLGASLEAMNKQDEARKEYQKIGKDDPAWNDAQLRLSAIDFSHEDYTSAEQRVKQVIARNPKMANAYLILSAIYLVQENYRALIDATQPAMALKHVPNRLLLNRAMAFEHFKRYSEVESMLKRLLASSPNDSEALNFLGYTYAEQGIKLDEAEQLIRRSLVAKPNDGYHLDSLAWVYYKRGDYRQAADIQTRALKSVPDDPVMNEHMGDIEWKLGRHEAARNHWKKAIELGHKDPEEMRRKIRNGI